MGRTKKENRRDFAGKHVKEEEKRRCHHHSPETLLLLLGGVKYNKPQCYCNCVSAQDTSVAEENKTT